MRKHSLLRVILALFIILAPQVASAADGPEKVTITRVDARSPSETKVRVVLNDSSRDSSPRFDIREGDKKRDVANVVRIDSLIANKALDRRTVVIVDTAVPVIDNRFDAEKQAVKDLIKRFPEDRSEQFSIIGAGNAVQRTGAFSSDHGRLSERIDSLIPGTKRSLNAAMDLATNQLQDVDAGSKNIIVFSSGLPNDVLIPSVLTRLGALNAKVFVVAISGGVSSNLDALKAYIPISAGGYYRYTDVAAMTSIPEDLSFGLNSEYELTYASKAKKAIKLQVAVKGTKSAETLSVARTDATGTSLKAQIVEPEWWAKYVPSWSEGTWRFLVAALGIIAVGFLVWVVFQVMDRKGSLEDALRPYEGERIDADEDRELHIETALMKRAIQMTEEIARDRGILNAIEDKLYQANWSINSAEFLFIGTVASILVAMAGFFTKGIIGLIVGLIIGVLGIPSVLNYAGAKRRRAFEAQLPDALQLLAGSLRAGFSLVQGIDATASQVDDPLGKELRQALAEARLGRPIEDALAELASRMQSADFSWTVMAVRIQREVGGNLAELLDTVARTMIERERLRREIKSLTAEGRLSAIILVLLPPGLAVYMFTTNPQYINTMMDDSLGKVVLAISITLLLGGVLWLKKMLRLDL